MKWHKATLQLFVAIMLLVLAFPALSPAEDVIIYPGYISGQINTGSAADAVVRNISVSASGGGYSASKSVTGNAYTLTMQGGTWNDTVNVSATASPSGSSYPYTSLSFSPRTLTVPVGETVVNNYSATGTVRFKLTITGDAYSNWYAYAYAVKSASGSQEQTYSQSYAHKYYSPTGTWDVPVVPNEQIRIYAYVYVDNQIYYFWYSSPDYRYENIGENQVIEIPLNVAHAVPHCRNGIKDADETGVDCGGADCSACYVPPTYEYGTVQGTVSLNLNVDSQDYSSVFSRHYPSGYTTSYVYTNPGDYSHTARTGTWTYRNQTYFSDSGRSFWFTWPYTNGDSTIDRVAVYANQTSVKNFTADAGILSGHLKFTGTMRDLYLNSSALNVSGASSYYVPGQGSIRQVTYGGSSSNTLAAGSDGSYRHFLTPGPWHPYTLNARKYNYDKGYYSNFQLSVYDYNYYYDGSTYNFGQPANVAAGVNLVQEREYCTGAVTLKFSVDGGGLLSSPYVSGTGYRYTSGGKQELYASVTSNSSASKVASPELDIHGPTGNYTLSTIRAVTEDGSTLYLKAIPVSLECGVWIGLDTSGPVVTVTSPAAGLITNAPTVTVSGTASDDTGVTSVTVNGAVVETTPTNNPNAPHEVAFSYTLNTVNGDNTILVKAYDAADHEGSNERHISVDQWLPTAAIQLPADGAIFPTGAAVPASVQASDRGYGYTLKVYLDNNKIGEVTGPANDATSQTISFSSELTDLAPGSHVLKADASDLAGNSASTIATFFVNTPPTVSANGPYTVNEGGSVIVTASGSDPEGGALAYAWDLDHDGTFETEGQSVTFSAASHDGASSRTIAVKATDNAALSSTAETTVSIANVAPTASLSSSAASIPEGGSVSVSFSNQYDPGVADTAAGFTYSFDCTNDGVFDATGASASADCSYGDNGTSTVKGRIQDKDGGFTDYTVAVVVRNVAPAADFNASSNIINEGGSIQVSFANPSDPGAADRAAGFLHAYDCTSDGTFESIDSGAASHACSYPDNGIYSVTGRITDKDGGSSEYTAVVTVNNVAPAVSAITAPVDLSAVNSTINATAQFADPGVLDTHSAVWEWGDSTTSAGMVTETAGSGSVSGSHAYTTAGVYTVKLTVTDKDGGSGTSVYQFVVIYDPSAGFVTGGGWISSPAGAVAANPSASGKVNFGFVAKYADNASTPGGQTEFNYSSAGVNFHSSSYEWLVVNGDRAQYRGAGTVNGSGNYTFLVTVVDGQVSGGADGFRIQIRDSNNNDALVYDSQPNADDSANPSAIDKGSIVIHGTNS